MIKLLFSFKLSEIPLRQQFSNVKRRRLAQSEDKSLLTRSPEDLKMIKILFARLVCKTLQSLKDHNIIYNHLEILITTYVPTCKVLEKKLFSKKRNLDQIFLALNDYWSFFDYELFCNELDEEKNKYISTLILMNFANEKY